MNINKIILPILVISVLSFVGCSISDDNEPNRTGSTQTPTSTPTLVPTLPPTEVKRAEEILQNMTIEEKVGQMFFVRLQKENTLYYIENYYPGGFIMFGNDFENESKESITELITTFQTKSKLPLLIGVDEEGGTVNRVSKYPAFRDVPFLSPMELFEEGGYNLIKSDTKEKAELLLSLGINVNLAPVCDISTDPMDFIYQRSFGKDAKETSEYIKTVVAQMKEDNIGITLKHFPGYGNNVDTHTGIAIDERSYNSFTTSDFLPFKEGIAAGADSILVSHNIINCIDETYPASLSPKVHEILRNELNFNGVIMTDDLAMDAVKAYAGDGDVAVQAILAGNDLLILSDFEQQISAVLSAVDEDVISESRLDESVTRILLWKLSLGIIE